MIDSTLADNTNIKYFKDTIYDVKTLKEYLRSEKKLFENTRLALEFLKINSSPEILKYNEFIFDNFKENINQNIYLSDNKNFEERIKKGIIEILMETNSLIYVNDDKRVSEKEKEKATLKNYKIHSYIYTPLQYNNDELDKIIPKIHKYFQSYATTELNKKEIEYYDTKHSEFINKNGFLIPKELNNTIIDKKKTTSILIINISKSINKDTTGLYLAAECRVRTKKMKDLYYKVKSYFQGGTHNKKRIFKKTKKNKTKNKTRRLRI
jgi:hypothetical protein